MNNTKWEEIRLAMYNYPSVVMWRTKDVETGYISNWDGEWFYHFIQGGYNTIEWLEIKVNNSKFKNEILDILRKIHVPGQITDNSIFVFGYSKDEPINYL